jgi:hypothetical protein
MKMSSMFPFNSALGVVSSLRAKVVCTRALLGESHQHQPLCCVALHSIQNSVWPDLVLTSLFTFLLEHCKV